jgi:hypothetical protein
LRLVDEHIDFGLVRERFKDIYSEAGRPFIDLEFLLRILLIGYFNSLFGFLINGRHVSTLEFECSQDSTHIQSLVIDYRLNQEVPVSCKQVCMQLQKVLPTLVEEEYTKTL